MTRTLFHHHPARRAGGYTVVEIVVTFLIIAVLAAVVTPTMTNRVREAKIATAEHELQMIAQSQERAAIDTGYLYRMYALNDSRGGDGIANALEDDNDGQIRNAVEGIQDNDIEDNNIYDRPYAMFISPQTQEYAPDQEGIWQRLETGLRPRAETAFGWNGPYMNWIHDENQNDWPDDPWGNDYIFFTRAGALFPPDRLAIDASVRDDDLSVEFQIEGPEVSVRQPNGGGIVRTRFKTDELFDRPTILSLGPNRLPGDGTDTAQGDYGRGDDIYYSFGGGF